MTNNKNETNNKRNKKIRLITIAIASFLLFITISAAASLALVYKDSIFKGIYVENINIGGLNIVDANNKIQENLKNALDNDKLILNYKDKSWKFNSKDLGLKYDFLKAINDAYLVGRKGTFFNRIHTIVRLLNNPYNVALKPSVDIEKINNVLNSIENEINYPGIDATIKRKDGQFVITEEMLGLRLNKEKTAEKISQLLLNSKFHDTEEIGLIMETITPKYIAGDLRKINNLLGSYTTKFNSRNISRSFNVALAAKSIDGKVFLPEEVFSFNDTVGARTTENGYKIAQVILKGKLVDGVGGGICQVSSTLYNAVLFSQLGVVERANHTIPSTYVPIGLDATVSYGVIDFKFKNTSNVPIYIESFVKGNKMTVNIYGGQKPNNEIKLTSKIDKVIKRNTEIVFDENMFEGDEVIQEKGRDGYRVSSYILIYENGKLVDKKLISKDYYRPSKQIVKRGLKKPNVQIDDIENDEVEINLDVNNEQ